MENSGMEKSSSTLTFNNLDMSSRLQLTENGFPQKKVTSDENSEELYDPFSHRDKSHSTSSIGALLHILKSSLGTGLLAMPSALKHGGLIFGIFGVCLTGFVCTHSLYMLVQCSRKLCIRVKKPKLDFAETAEIAFKTGPPRYRFLSPVAREFIYVALFSTYFFGVAVYVIFISRSFQQILERHLEMKLQIRIFTLLLAILIVPLSIHRSLKFYVPFSALANSFLIFGISLTIYYTLNDIPDIKSREFMGSISHWPLFFATSLYAMEGIGTVLPIENAMRYPEHFLGLTGVLNVGMGVVTFLFIFVGFFGYWKFGSATEATITLNLPNSLLAESVKLLVALCVLFTYGLQFTVPAEIMWERLVKKGCVESKNMVGYYVMRGLLIFGTIAIAAALPSISPVISLVGAICFSTLGLLCPAVIEIMTLAEYGYGRFNWKLWKDIVLIIVALSCLVTGALASIDEIITAIDNNEL